MTPSARPVHFGPASARRRGRHGILGLLTPSGRLLAAECKRPGNRPTPDQRGFLDAVRAAGGLALVVRDVGELAVTLDAAPRAMK
jgi:hypothetical protein